LPRTGKPKMINHDRLFKQVLANFFLEFADLFLPEPSSHLARASHLLDKELFDTSAKVHKRSMFQADLVFNCRTRLSKTGQGNFLVHIELQAKRQAYFGLRLLRYRLMLYEKYKLPVYSVALFSFDRPKSAEPASRCFHG
jgi:hypothetical protein